MGCTTGKEVPADEAYGEPSKKNGKASKKSLPPGPAKQKSIDAEEEKPATLTDKVNGDDSSPDIVPLEQKQHDDNDNKAVASENPPVASAQVDVEIKEEVVQSTSSYTSTECVPPSTTKEEQAAGSDAAALAAADATDGDKNVALKVSFGPVSTEVVATGPEITNADVVVESFVAENSPTQHAEQPAASSTDKEQVTPPVNDEQQEGETETVLAAVTVKFEHKEIDDERRADDERREDAAAAAAAIDENTNNNEEEEEVTEEMRKTAVKIVHDVIVEAVRVVESSPEEEAAAAEDDGTDRQKASNGAGKESEAAVRIQTKYRQYHAKKVVKEMKKERQHQTDSTQAGDENKATESGGHLADDSDVPVSYSQVNGEHSGKDLTDEERARAAVKIQAGLRGMRDRKMVKSMKSQSRDQSNDVTASHVTSD